MLEGLIRRIGSHAAKSQDL